MKVLKKMKLNEQGKTLESKEMMTLRGGASCSYSGCGSDATVNVNNVIRVMQKNN